MKRLSIFLCALFLNGCVLPGFNMCGKFLEPNSPCAHDLWVESFKKEVGRNIHSSYMEYRKNSNMFIGSRTLLNGNIENGYVYRFQTCHYFYEYEPKSGVIIGFRYEELKGQYSCRLTGA